MLQCSQITYSKTESSLLAKLVCIKQPYAHVDDFFRSLKETDIEWLWVPIGGIFKLAAVLYLLLLQPHRLLECWSCQFLQYLHRPLWSVGLCLLRACPDSPGTHLHLRACRTAE